MLFKGKKNIKKPCLELLSYNLQHLFFGCYFFFPIFLLCLTFICQLFDFSISKVYNIVLMGTSISFYYCIWLLLKFFESSDIWGLPIEFQIDLILHPSLNYVLPIGVDSLSIWFVILNHLIIYLSLLYTFSTQNKQYGFIYCLLLLQWGIGGAFMVFDLLGFFIFIIVIALAIPSLI